MNVKRKFDTFLFLPVLGLIVYGIIMIFSASSPTAALSPECGYDPFYFLKRHLIWLSVGVVAMVFAYRMDLEKWRKYALPMVILSMLMMVGVLLFGKEVLGARRWLSLGPLSFQPSEFAKIAVIFYLADALARRKDKVHNFTSLLSVLMVFGAVVILIEKQPDLGTTIVVGASLIGMLFLGGARVSHILAMTVIGVIVAGSRIMDEAYRVKRILSFLNPWQDPQGIGYQVIQSFIALGSGGMTGLGLGESRQKYFYLPEKFTDFIFAITGEELGFYFGTLPIVLLFMFFLYRGLRVAGNTRDPFLSLVAGGVTFQIVFQAFVNMGVVSGILPCTGIPLPFISFGGSSLVFTMFSLGLLFNVAGLPDRNERESSKEMRPRFSAPEPAPVRRICSREEGEGTLIPARCESSSQEEAPEAIYTRL